MYNAYVTRIKNIRKHSNADRLQVATVFGNDVIVGLNTQEGDLVVYFPTDGKLGEEFAKENKLTRELGGYLDDNKRHVTTIKLRGERSDGLILGIESLSKFTDVSKLKEGDTISVLGGVEICSKYVPYRKPSNPNPSSKVKTKKAVEDKESFPLFKEHSDTAQLAYNLGQFKAGDECVVTLKMHGTSQRTSYTIKEEKVEQGFLARLFKRKDKINTSWDYVTGTRRVTLKTFDSGFYGSNSFRQQWHDLFVGKLHKGESVYYEVVGYTDTGSLIMGECDNTKTRDKEFIKQYGKTTQFTYGCEYGQSDIYVYRMTMTNEDGNIVEYPWHLVKTRCEQMGVKHVPELTKVTFGNLIGGFGDAEEDERKMFMHVVNLYADGPDPIGKSHIREGVIVRIDNKEKFTAFKHKSFNFKVLEGLIKADAEAPDMEENQDQVEE
jgi:tRNA-binding EMAP/Myf-like protein